MNTNNLARMYNLLTPRERLPLILAASVRGDDAEHGRLTQTAPRLSYAVPDYYGLAEGVHMALKIYLLEQLDLAALYWEVTAAITDREADPGGPHEQANRLRDALRLVSLLLVLRTEGWQLFCEEYGIDGAPLLALLPGAERLERTLTLARQDACTRDEAQKQLRQQWGDDTLNLITPESVQASCRAIVQFQAGTWK